MPSPLDYANPSGAAQRGANNITNFGNSAVARSLADILALISGNGPKQQDVSPMVASEEMMQGIPGAQPVANPRAQPQQESAMQKAFRWLGM